MILKLPVKVCTSLIRKLGCFHILSATFLGRDNQNFALPVPHLGVLGNGFCSPVATAVSATTLTGFYSSRATILLRTTLLQPPKSRETGLNNVSRARLPARRQGLSGREDRQGSLFSLSPRVVVTSGHIWCLYPRFQGWAIRWNYRLRPPGCRMGCWDGPAGPQRRCWRPTRTPARFFDMAWGLYDLSMGIATYPEP